MDEYYSPANLKNFCVSDGKSEVTDDTDICLLGLSAPGETGPGDGGGIISALSDPWGASCVAGV